jgi:peptidyl-prolyl cis-trans isomerase C
MPRRLSIAFLSLTALFALASLGLAQAGEEAPAEDPEAEAVDDEARRARVLLRAGDRTLTVGEVEDAVNEQPPFIRWRYRNREALEAFVDTMIRVELLSREADRQGFGGRPEVRKAVDENAVQQLTRRDIDERFAPESLPLEDVEQYFTEHPEEFNRPEMRRAAHIAVASEAEARRVLEQARGSDARAFRALARDQSLDGETRLRGGDLRFFDAEGRGRNPADTPVAPELAAAAFALEASGDVVAEPVQVGERWSVLKLTGIRPAREQSLRRAEPAIRLRLSRQRRAEALQELVAELREQAGVETHPELLERIVLDPPAETASDEPTAAPPAEAEEPAAEGEGPAAETAPAQ